MSQTLLQRLSPPSTVSDKRPSHFCTLLHIFRAGLSKKLIPLFFIFSCISSTNKSLITSLLSVGTLGGALSGAYFADVRPFTFGNPSLETDRLYNPAQFFGRRGGIMIASGIFVAGAAVQTVSQLPSRRRIDSDMIMNALRQL